MGLIPVGSSKIFLCANILLWRLILKYFLSLLLIQEGQLLVSGKRICISTG